ADLRDWAGSQEQVDVVVSNATLQWLPDHLELLPALAYRVRPGGWLAFQVPGNFAAPSHVIIRSQAASEPWHDRLHGLLRDEHAVHDPQEYAEPLTGVGCEVEAWETTYLHRLTGPDPILSWVTGTALRPVRTALDDTEWAAFTAELAPRLRAAYPMRPDGTTWFPFRRIFAVAHAVPRSATM
ncbi:MAG: methyltransferase domain-containing protein, partial [Pseudonocardiaceae bacterium]